VIRATANNRFDTQLHRTVITIDAAPALAAPPDLIYRLALIAAAHKSLAARVARRADAIDRRGVAFSDRATAVWLRRRDL
jgi:hypothetical protein